MRILLLLLLPIGDTLFATPTIRALRRAYPGARIAALVYPTNAGILEANPDIEKLVLHPTSTTWRGWADYARLLWGLRRARFDLLVQFGPAQWWLARLIGPERERRLAYPVWQWFVPLGPRPWRHRHAVASFATLLRPSERAHLPPGPILTCTASDRAHVTALLAGISVDRLIAVHPGGEGFRGMKRWPLARFVMLSRRLSRRHAARIVVLGGADETALAASLVAQVQGSLSLAGRLNLAQTVAVLERCMLFVGNDSAPMHMAAALGIPTLGIFGPTNPINFRPLGAHAQVVRSGLGCSPCFHFVGSHSLWTGSRCRVPSCLHALSSVTVQEAAERLLTQAT